MTAESADFREKSQKSSALREERKAKNKIIGHGFARMARIS